jgi:hypothetical protein
MFLCGTIIGNVREMRQGNDVTSYEHFQVHVRNGLHVGAWNNGPLQLGLVRAFPP